MSADPRSSKHYKSCRYEIKSTQPESQIYVTIDRYLLAIIMFKWKMINNLVTSSRNVRRTWSQCMPGRVFTLVCGKTWRLIQEKFYKSKISSRFPNFDTSNAWQMGHNSPEGIFLGQELLLDRPVPIVLGNFWATFGVWSNFLRY